MLRSSRKKKQNKINHLKVISYDLKMIIHSFILIKIYIFFLATTKLVRLNVKTILK